MLRVRVSRASSTRRTGSSISATSSRTPGASCRSRSSSPSLPSATAAAWQACSCGRARKPAAKAGRVRTSPPSAGSPRRTGPRAPSPADASRWLDGRLRTTVGAATGKVNLDFYGLGGDAASLDQKVRYSLNFSAGDRAGQLAARTRVAMGGRVALCLCRRGSEAARGFRPCRPPCRTARQSLGTHRRPRVRHPGQPVHADPGRLRRDLVSGLARGSGREQGLRALRADRDGLAAAAESHHPRRARELRLVVERDAVLPPALHPAAGGSGDALSG